MNYIKVTTILTILVGLKNHAINAEIDQYQYQKFPEKYPIYPINDGYYAQNGYIVIIIF